MAYYRFKSNQSYSLSNPKAGQIINTNEKNNISGVWSWEEIVEDGLRGEYLEEISEMDSYTSRCTIENPILF